MKKILDSLVGFGVVVSMSSSAIEGKLLSYDAHGVLIQTDNPESKDEIPEKYAVFIPHSNVQMVHARQDNNTSKTSADEYKFLFN